MHGVITVTAAVNHQRTIAIGSAAIRVAEGHRVARTGSCINGPYNRCALRIIGIGVAITGESGVRTFRSNTVYATKTRLLFLNRESCGCWCRAAGFWCAGRRSRTGRTGQLAPAAALGPLIQLSGFVEAETVADMSVEERPDRIREQQRVIQLLRHAFINVSSAAIPEGCLQGVTFFIIGNGS